MRFRHVIGACALALATASCSLGDVTDAGTINVYIDVNDSQLTVQQESIIFTITARNVGYSPVTLTGPADCLLVVEVRDQQGTVVWSSNGGCTGAQVSEELAAGLEKVQQFTWDGRNNGGGFLAPGLYNVRALVRLTTGNYPSPAITVALD